MEQMSEWVPPVFAAIVSAILTHAFSTSRIRAEWRREADMIQQALCRHEGNAAAALGEISAMRHEYEARFTTFDNNINNCNNQCAMHVTEYEIEQKLQNLMIRIDELRRRLVAVEDQVLGFNLDGSPTGQLTGGRRAP
jgi:hypothetical protein